MLDVLSYMLENSKGTGRIEERMDGRVERKGPVERERDWCGFKKFGRVEKREKGGLLLYLSCL